MSISTGGLFVSCQFRTGRFFVIPAILKRESSSFNMELVPRLRGDDIWIARSSRTITSKEQHISSEPCISKPFFVNILSLSFYLLEPHGNLAADRRKKNQMIISKCILYLRAAQKYKTQHFIFMHKR